MLEFDGTQLSVLISTSVCHGYTSSWLLDDFNVKVSYFATTQKFVNVYTNFPFAHTVLSYTTVDKIR